MDKFLSDQAKIKLIGLAIYQIAGGIIGIIITIQILLGAEAINGLVILLLFLAFGLYSFSIYCGQCLIRHKLKRGLDLSTINQALQSISFAMFGYSYKFCSGIFLYLGVDLTDGYAFSFKLQFSNFQFTINMDKEILTVGINVVALFLLYFIDNLQKQVKGEIGDFETSKQTILDSELILAKPGPQSNAENKI